jgi:Lon protease-like protein
MTQFSSQSDQLRNFTGRVPLFPLPDAVLFPHALLPLMIFEPRYRQMIADVLTSDRLIAMALLEPGWESTYESKTAPIRQTVCIGRIASSELLPDGRYQIDVDGLSRAEVLDEDDSPHPYRIARVELCPEMPAGLSQDQRRRTQRELLVGFQQLAAGCDFDRTFHDSLDADLPLGGLCDVIAYSLPLEPDVAQSILEEPDIASRSMLVLDEMRHCIESDIGHPSVFPPPYSLN